MFTLYCWSSLDAGAGIVDVAILDPHGRKDTVRPMVTQKGPELWYVDYTPLVEGLHSVNIFFAAKPIPLSPYPVQVAAGESVPLPLLFDFRLDFISKFLYIRFTLDIPEPWIGNIWIYHADIQWITEWHHYIILWY